MIKSQTINIHFRIIGSQPIWLVPSWQSEEFQMAKTQERRSLMWQSLLQSKEGALFKDRNFRLESKWDPEHLGTAWTWLRMKTEGVLKAILLRLYISERLFKPRSLYLSSISDITVSICVPNYIYVYNFFYWEREILISSFTSPMRTGRRTGTDRCSLKSPWSRVKRIWFQ